MNSLKTGGPERPPVARPDDLEERIIPSTSWHGFTLDRSGEFAQRCTACDDVAWAGAADVPCWCCGEPGVPFYRIVTPTMFGWAVTL